MVKRKSTSKRRTTYRDAVTGKVIPKTVATALRRSTLPRPGQKGFIGPLLPSASYQRDMGEGFIGPRLRSGAIF